MDSMRPYRTEREWMPGSWDNWDNYYETDHEREEDKRGSARRAQHTHELLTGQGLWGGGRISRTVMYMCCLHSLLQLFRLLFMHPCV